MSHNPASVVRLLYGERAQKRKPRRSAFSQSCQQQFDIRLSHRSRPTFENAMKWWACFEAPSTDLVVECCAPREVVAGSIVGSEEACVKRWPPSAAQTARTVFLLPGRGSFL